MLPNESPTAGVEETSLSNIGFSDDANAEETGSETESVGDAETERQSAEQTSEAEATEESPDATEEGSDDEPLEADAEESAEGEESGEEEPQGYDLLLPTQQQRAYPEELYQLAAKKFGIDPSLLEHKSVKDLIKGKIDSDIEIRNLHDQLPEEEAEEAEESEEAEPEAVATGERQPVTPERQLEATYRFIREGRDGQPIISDAGARIFSEQTLEAYTELSNAMESGDKGKIAAAQRKYTETQLAFVTTAFANVLPQLLPHMVGNLPGEIWDPIVGAKMEQREEMKDTHRSARETLQQDPRYSDLPKLIKSGAIYNFVRDNPEIMEKQFRDSAGNIIRDPVRQNVERYRYVVHQLRGQNYQPPVELVKQATKAGERHATEMAQRKAAGRVTPGRTRGNLGGQGGRYDEKEWADRMKRSAETSDPLGTFLANVKP